MSKTEWFTHSYKNQTNIKQSLKRRPFPWTVCRSSEGQRQQKRNNEFQKFRRFKVRKLQTCIPETAELSSRRIYMTPRLTCRRFSWEQKWLESWGTDRNLSLQPCQVSTGYLQADSEEYLISTTWEKNWRKTCSKNQESCDTPVQY